MSKTKSTTAATLREPEITGQKVWLWNRGQPITRHTTRCGNLMLAINVQNDASDVPGRGGQNDNRTVRLRPGLAQVDAGYMARVNEDVERQEAYAKRTRSPLSGVAAWLERGELVELKGGLDELSKRDAKEAIEGSSDLTLVLEIANGSGPHADIARSHLERITDGGSAILGHFSTHDKN